MKRILSLIVIAAITISGTGCQKINGKGDLVTENRNLSGFHGISLSMQAMVYFHPDSVFHLAVSAQENLMPYIETFTEGGTLIIKIRDHYVLGKHDQISINVSGPGIVSVDVNGSGEISVTGPWQGNELLMDVSGSGNIIADTLSAGNLTADISGSGYMRVNKGQSNTSSLEISGSGTMRMEGVKTGTVNATITGSGDLHCWAEQKLVATISGSGSIYYKGSPQIETHISGSGSVSPMSP